MTWFVRCFAALCAIKGLDMALHETVVAALMWWISVGVMLRWQRIGAGLIVVVPFVADGTGLGHLGSHAIFIASVAAILALWPDTATRVIVLRAQMTIVYGFAGLHKINEQFLSGATLEARSEWLPWPQVVAPSAVAIELWLAVAVWSRWRSALPVAVVLHLGIVVGWTNSVSQFLLLVVFNGLSLAAVWVVSVGGGHVASRHAGALQQGDDSGSRLR